MKRYIPLISVFISFASCKKQDDFLNAKPNQSLIVPTTLEEYQSLLNNEGIFNLDKDPALGSMAGEDYYITTDYWQSLYTANERNSYIFASDIYQSETYYGDWNVPYVTIFNANTVLDGISKLDVPADKITLLNQVKGSALFFRSYYFYSLLQTYSMPYDPTMSNSDLGIPLRLTSDLNVKSVRPSVQQCYDRIIGDLKEAFNLLPKTSNFKTRPSQLTVNALLARISVAIGDYDNAFKYANASLEQNNILDDYNNITPTSYSISESFLQEDIFHTTMTGYDILSRSFASVDTTLYKLYNDNDLRKNLYFEDMSGQIAFKGTYDYLGGKFTGLANDEIFLIRAECYARKGETGLAMKDLNTLLEKRWKAGTFITLTAADANEALNIILTERRKELVFRGIRWTDLRRLNKENRFKTSLIHIVNGTTYTLPPNDKRYAMPIPNDEVQLSGIPQNDR